MNTYKSINFNELLYFNNSISSQNISVYFRDLKSRLLDHIEETDAIIGAVAWITDLDILNALAKRQTLLVIQKEDFLRPDMKSRLTKKDKQLLHEAYNKFLPFDGSKIAVGPFYQSVDATYTNLDPILCFGIYNEGSMYKTPRMHNKFLVFFKEIEKILYPYSVWTGSLNLTQLSLNSLENAIVIHDEIIASAYAEEAELIYLQGEPLNWESSWINPFRRTTMKRGE